MTNEAVLERPVARNQPAKNPNEQSTIKIGDLMTRDVITLHPQALAKFAVSTMAHNGIRHMIVVDQGRIVGVFSQRDLLRHIASRFNEGRDPGRVPISEFMSSPVETTTPETPLSSAAYAMAQKRIGCLAVVDKLERLIGILTRSDVMKHISHLEGFASLVVNR